MKRKMRKNVLEDVKLSQCYHNHFLFLMCFVSLSSASHRKKESGSEVSLPFRLERSSWKCVQDWEVFLYLHMALPLVFHFLGWNPVLPGSQWEGPWWTVFYFLFVCQSVPRITELYKADIFTSIQKSSPGWYHPSLLLFPSEELTDCLLTQIQGCRFWSSDSLLAINQSRPMFCVPRLHVPSVLVESQNILCWKGPTRIIESNSWLHRGPPRNQTTCLRALSKYSTCCWCNTGTGWSTYLLDIEEWASAAAPPTWSPSRLIRSRLPPRLSWGKKDPKSEVRFCFPPRSWLKLSNHYPWIVITTLCVGGSS